MRQLLVEKYRPKSLENFIGDDDLISKMEEYIKQQNIPNLIFTGKPGSGKTTIAKILASNIECDYLFLNATDERSVDTMRDKVGSFASSASFKPLKIVILDEATHILQASQVLLLNMMETYSAKTRFILTGNYPERVIEPLKSRCVWYKISPPSKKEVALHIKKILDTEQVNFDPKELAPIINDLYPDIRRILNFIDGSIIDGKVVIKTNLSENIYKDEVLNELKSPNKSSFNNIRQIIANADISDYTDLYHFLFENTNAISDTKSEELVITLAEYQYQSTFIIDKELNICALFAKILSILRE